MWSTDDKVGFTFQAECGGKVRYGTTEFNRDFFDNAIFAYRHYYEQVERIATQALALFLDVPEERVYELLQEESQPQTKEGEGELQQGADKS